MESFDSDEALALYIARNAGQILCNLRNNSELSGKELGNFADKAANDFIVETIKKHRPNDAILSEEECDDKKRLSKSRVWIIDPLDGTYEYCENRNDWAVHIALAINNKPELGIVAIPSSEKIYSSNSLISREESKAPIKIAISRSRTPQIAYELGRFLNAELIPMGSAGVKAMAVVEGNVDIYFHIGEQKEWDNCAPVAIALANGLHVSRLNGNEITYNNEDVVVNDLLICRKEFASDILAWCNERK
ncbi:MAG: 3'(2'),5'-bisphosphate nucleotidase CysQ [Caulobacterales bacterium]|nr:3'(2'),5'-bisphosphate nucleotidase CysQ [Caulobacterales bacterium]MCA0374017.1 3'(2'),5'-bisphosphate nucleotidase CysQ [Pseudomonadota bacterium]